MTKTANNTPKKKPRRMAREPQPKITPVAASAGTADHANHASALPSASDAKPPTKTAAILGLLTRSEGATLDQLVEATGWLPHTTRAALTGLKKKGFEITSIKVDGVRTYRVTDKRELGAADERQPAGTIDA
ncbi:DUF3489 domain-containing protein [Tsuneonella sp. YG55]|uniref:DUF3489 domain-containing protein n=1 Tax=Tsuneonella litorea TaxID=2976475 RepID=A0A9X2W0C2_9SPHN|nr:DUF3489 domain-containing protein [Tsuneonella litorea]MCT2557545.1 DUF3489 domain-containing protein [Tsuneonella litorea]